MGFSLKCSQGMSEIRYILIINIKNKPYITFKISNLYVI